MDRYGTLHRRASTLISRSRIVPQSVAHDDVQRRGLRRGRARDRGRRRTIGAAVRSGKRFRPATYKAPSALRDCCSAAPWILCGTRSSDSSINSICLLSPPHLFLLAGLFFLITGPVRSALLRRDEANLFAQLPMLISLGLAFEIIQFVTQYGFYPEALMRDHPLSQITHHERTVYAFGIPLLSSSARDRDRDLAKLAARRRRACISR